MCAPIKPAVLVVEAGGTRTTAIIADKNGILAKATSGSGNFKTSGLNAAVARIRDTVDKAISQLPHDRRHVVSSPFPFQSVYVGMAGLDRESDVIAIVPHLSAFLPIDKDDSARFRVGNDCSPLAVPALRNDILEAVAVVAGTGSVAFHFVKDSEGIPQVKQRAGGYGALIDDAGSGYHVGKMAVKAALTAYDQGEKLSPFHLAVFRHFGCEAPSEQPLLLERVLELGTPGYAEHTITSRIATVCKATLDFAFADTPDNDALHIATQATIALKELVLQLVSGQRQDDEKALVLGGSLFRSDGFRNLLLQALADAGLRWRKVVVIEFAGETAAQILAMKFT